MKYVFALALFWFLTAANAQKLKIYNDLDKAERAAAKDNKLLLVDVYTDWCGWCKIQDKKTFTDSQVIETLNKGFIVLKINAEKLGDGFDFATRYSIRSYPNIYILNTGNRLVHVIQGYREAPEFRLQLDSAAKLNQKGFYYSGYSSAKSLKMPSFFYNRFQNEKRNGTAISQKSLDSFFFIKKFNSEESFLMIKLTGLPDLYVDEAIETLKLMRGSFPNEEIDDIIYTHLFEQVSIYAKDSTKSEKDIDMLIQKYASGNSEETLYQSLSLKLLFYEQRNNWADYARLYDDFIHDPARWNAESVNEYAWTIYENATDSTALKLALEWITRVVSASDDYDYHDTYASLLFANGRNEEAETAALHAIELGNAGGKNVKPTQELLQRIRSKP